MTSLPVTDESCVDKFDGQNRFPYQICVSLNYDVYENLVKKTKEVSLSQTVSENILRLSY